MTVLMVFKMSSSAVFKKYYSMMFILSKSRMFSIRDASKDQFYQESLRRMAQNSCAICSE
jgi:hypothetical protein